MDKILEHITEVSYAINESVNLLKRRKYLIFMMISRPDGLVSVTLRLSSPLADKLL